MIILPFLKLIIPSCIEFFIEYKKQIFIGIIAVALVFSGYRWGGSDIKADWDKSIEDIRIKSDEQRDEWKKKADAIASEYQSYKSKSSISMARLRKEGINEISSNDSLNGCNATTKFVRIYEQAGSGSFLPSSSH